MWKRLALPAAVVLAILGGTVAVSSSFDGESAGPDRDEPPLNPDIDGDTDGDGFRDELEVHNGTDPRDRQSNPATFPNRANTGVPPGWTPKKVRTDDLRVTRRGAVVSDVLLKNADIAVMAPNVTLRRVELRGGVINNWVGESCDAGLVIERSTIGPAPGQNYGNDSEGVISYGGYTADRVEIHHRSEGFRASGCGPVRVEDSFALITPPHPCGDWHGDGLQGYEADAIKVRNVTLELDIVGCGGTAPFFVPAGQNNTSVDVQRLLVKGGGYPFRLGVPGTVTGLKVANRSWAFAPVDVVCSGVREWEAEIVDVTRDYQVTRHVRKARCRGSA
jgi:hypothetical protein